MKKLAIALSFACAGALAFADSAQWNTTAWITGIGSGATAVDALDATGGTWSGITSDNAAFADSTLTIETESEVKFTVSADTTAKTAQKITVKCVFTPCSASDLSLGSALNTSNSQLGFAVVTGDDSSSYYAWVGTATATDGSAINDWVELATCPNVENETELTVALNYWGGTATATFAIKNGGETVALKENVSATQTLTSTAATSAAKVGEIACTGSGSLTALDGVTGIAVASVATGDTTNYYATVDEAIAAVKDNGGTIEVVATPEGKVTSDETDTFDDTKECVVAAGGTVTVQPKESIMKAITVGGKALTADTAKLRTFLNTNCNSAYNGAQSTATALQTALETTGSNTLALWQDYALGIEPTTTLSVKPAATDTDSSNITLALGTTVTPSGDYTITYVCGEQTSTDASAIKVPATTGNHPVMIRFE